MKDDLQRFLDDKPITARRPTLIQRTAKWSRRHRAIVASTAVATAVLFDVITAAAVAIASKERENRIIAEKSQERERERSYKANARQLC